ncbi:MarR family winged helix-turn-helix transcriptional regulator [Humibacter albus]|uniref:MarR family winged helix-turn-helix transcriptional regulator n=1 Tax=Humibacter albus TaxID=427754 RepID=UPI0003B354F8|nr:MarR family transcriptional regulator [Humibacter albus]
MLTEPITLPVRGDAGVEAEMHFLLTDLVQIAGRVTRLAHRSSQGSEGPATWRTLAVLQQFGPMRLGELAQHSQVAQPTMTKIVAGLVEREWVKRIADASDARAWQIGISAKGILKLTEWRSNLAGALQPLFADLSDDERETVRRAIDLIQPRIDQAYIDPDTFPAKGE